MTERPSAAAHVIAQLVPVLDERTCRQLRALLADDLATRDPLAPAVCSLAGIATLIDVVGRVPTIDEYEDARKAQPEWPHHSTLVRRYGSWLTAVSAAVKVTQEQPRWSVASRPPQRRLSRADCVRAILRCRLAIGDWPDDREYMLWQQVEGDLCRRTGALERVPPSRSAVRTRLRTWPDALELARRQSRVASTDA
jgi:hypothetical protein